MGQGQRVEGDTSWRASRSNPLASREESLVAPSADRTSVQARAKILAKQSQTRLQIDSKLVENRTEIGSKSNENGSRDASRHPVRKSIPKVSRKNRVSDPPGTLLGASWGLSGRPWSATGSSLGPSGGPWGRPRPPNKQIRTLQSRFGGHFER